MAASAPSTFPSETHVKDHLYQVLKKPGPRGAYEARQFNGDLYVRVDMPGVPPEGVQLVKRADARTINFTGRAPKYWEDCNTSDRVYGGYVALDKNPDKVDVEMTVLNGSLRLFLPDCDGVLHSLRSRTSDSGAYYLQEEFSEAAQEFGVRFDRVITSPEGSHINPFLLDGTEGVYETETVEDASGERQYLRVDLPGLGKEDYYVDMDRIRDALFHGGEGKRYHPLDFGGRTYFGGAKFLCSCCKIREVVHEMKDGVLRISFRPKRDPDLKKEGTPCFLVYLH